MDTSRRQLLGATAAAAAVATLPIAAATAKAPDRRAWDAAMNRLQAADTEYQRARARARRDYGSDIRTPPAMTSELDRLCESRCDAEEAVMATPAPDLSSLRWKLDLFREPDGDVIAWSADFARQTFRDIARLLPQGR